MAAFLGIDVSTTATKALLMGEDGEVIAVAATEHPLEMPRPLWSEQFPHHWWDGTVQSIRRLLSTSGIAPEQIRAVGLTGQMHGLVLLDGKGEVLRPAILWNDQRTGPQCDAIRARVGRARLIQITGNDALTGFTAPKILWVQEHEPEVWQRVRHILLPKDYVRYRLTGTFATDCADGSGMLLFDLRRRTWSLEVLDALHIPPDYLPSVHEGPEITGSISEEAAQETGLRPGTPVVAGGGDQAAQAIGVGAVEPGILALTLGTSGVLFAPTDQPVVESEGQLHAFCHAVPGRWHLMGVMLSAGGSLRWFRDVFAPEASYEALTAMAARVPVGSGGLLFLPYLTGERTPHSDPLARGAFVGLTARHTLAHLVRAVLEGVALGLRDNFERIRQVGGVTIHQIRISGGGARSSLWRQILADALQVELVTVNTTEGAAYGAAILAAVGVGWFSSVADACHQLVRITGHASPGPDAVRYEELYERYRTLYPTLRPLFPDLALLEASGSPM